jgi:hypothetical protein
MNAPLDNSVALQPQHDMRIVDLQPWHEVRARCVVCRHERPIDV